MNYNKEAKSLTFRRGSEVSQESMHLFKYADSGPIVNKRASGLLLGS